MLYVAATLTRDSQRALYEAVSALVPIPADWTKYCHHMTIRFRPKPGDPLPPLNQPTELTVTEYAADEKGIAVKVEPTSREALKLPDSQLPHVTVAVAPGVGPVYSNELLRNRTLVKFPSSLVLQAVTWAKNGSGGYPERDDLALEQF